jgi:hypothetical protein
MVVIHGVPRRQKAGSVLKTFGPGPGPAGGVNAPASTVCASVMAVFGGCSEDRSAQAAASADCATKTRIGSFITDTLADIHYSSHGIHRVEPSRRREGDLRRRMPLRINTAEASERYSGSLH